MHRELEWRVSKATWLYKKLYMVYSFLYIIIEGTRSPAWQSLPSPVLVCSALALSYRVVRMQMGIDTEPPCRKSKWLGSTNLCLKSRLESLEAIVAGTNLWDISRRAMGLNFSSDL